MASIDKIYMNIEQGKQFWLFILEHQDKCERLTNVAIARYMAETVDKDENHSGYVVNYPECVDWYLLEYCKLDFIQGRIKEQYESKMPINTYEQLLLDFIDICEGVKKAKDMMQRLIDHNVAELLEGGNFLWELNNFEDTEE